MNGREIINNKIKDKINNNKLSDKKFSIIIVYLYCTPIYIYIYWSVYGGF